MSAPKADAEALAELKAGDTLEILEIAGGWAWGTAPAQGLVGYVRADAFEDPA